MLAREVAKARKAGGKSLGQATVDPRNSQRDSGGEDVLAPTAAP